jgi:hypothetical protein
MKPPTISEDEEAEAAAEAGADAPSSSTGEAEWDPETADKEVAEWVRSALERKLSGMMGKSDKPALHAVPLDAVPGSPLLDRDGLKLHMPSTTAQLDPGDAGKEEEEEEEEEALTAAAAAAAAAADPEPRDGVTVESPELRSQKVHPMDFADGIAQGSGDKGSEKDSERENEAQAPEMDVDRD